MYVENMNENESGFQSPNLYRPESGRQNYDAKLERYIYKTVIL